MKLSNYYKVVLNDVRSPREEFINVITHGIGLIFAIAGTAYLLATIFFGSANVASIAGGLAFGISLVLVYFSSTVYHASNRPRLRHIWNVLDHIAIYFLIAGTYTPFILLFVRSTQGYSVLIGLWCIAIVGLVYKIFAVKKHKVISTLMYLAMGWAALLILKPLTQSVPGPILLWIVAGGICYSLGTIFYLSRRLPYHHAIWHLFVLAGSICHYFGVLTAVNA